MVIKILALDYPVLTKGETKQEPVDVAIPQKMKVRGRQGRSHERINLFIKTCLLKETYQFPVIIKEESMAGPLE